MTNEPTETEYQSTTDTSGPGGELLDRLVVYALQAVAARNSQGGTLEGHLRERLAQVVQATIANHAADLAEARGFASVLGPRWSFTFTGRKVGAHVEVVVRCGAAGQRALLGLLTTDVAGWIELKNAARSLGAEVEER